MLNENKFKFVFVLLLLLLSACAPSKDEQLNMVCLSDQCINVEIAQTDAQRMKGLQLRESLGKNEGMLFIFPTSRQHSFWMKKTLISLDIIWIDQSKRIVTIMAGILPCKTEQCPVYTPEKSAAYVLEVNAGVAAEFGLKVGDQLTFH